MTSGYCEYLESLGYPMPQIDMADGESVLLNLLSFYGSALQLNAIRLVNPSDGMILVNTFEETFGDAYREGVWDEFSRSASSDIDRYVVALASFKGDLQ